MRFGTKKKVLKEFTNRLNLVHNIPFNNLFMSKNLLMDLNGNIINEFNSTQEASRILGISQGLISNCCNGGYWRDKHSKFIKCTRVGEFKFKEDEINKS